MKRWSYFILTWCLVGCAACPPCGRRSLGWSQLHPEISPDGKKVILSFSEFEAFYLRHVLGIDPTKADPE